MASRFEATFAEIERRYLSRFPPIQTPPPPELTPVDDPQVSDEQAADMGNITDFNELDPDLARAKQISEIGQIGQTEADGNLGTTVAYPVLRNTTLGPVSTPTVAVIQAQTNGRDRDVWNVALGAVTPLNQQYFGIPPSELIPMDFLAKVEYGSAGFSETIWLDWLNGLTFQIPGDFVRVSAQLRVFAGLAVGLVNFSVNVSAFLNRGVKTRTSKLTYSEPFALAAAGNTVFPVPPHATNLNLYWTPTTGGTAVKKMYAAALDAKGNILYDQEWDNNGNDFPILAGCVTVELINNDSNPVSEGRVAWTIEA